MFNINMMSTNLYKRIYAPFKRCPQTYIRWGKILINRIFINEERFIGSSDQEKMEWQIKVVLFYFSLLYMPGVFIAIFTPVEPSSIFYKYANAAQAVCLSVTLALALKKVINLQKAIAAVLTICTAEIMVEMFYEAIYNASAAPLNITTNMILLACLASTSALTYMKRLSFSISACAVLGYIACGCLAQSREMKDYAYLIVLSFICVTAIGVHLAKVFERLRNENRLYKEEQREMLDYMELTREEWKEFMDALRVTNKRVDINKREKVRELVNQRLESRIAYQAKELLKEEQDYSPLILRHCATLTNRELKVATFIAKGMTSAEISSTLNTSISTVTTIRSRIRNKCGLDKNASLQSYLGRLVNGE